MSVSISYALPNIYDVIPYTVKHGSSPNREYFTT